MADVRFSLTALERGEGGLAGLRSSREAPGRTPFWPLPASGGRVPRLTAPSSTSKARPCSSSPLLSLTLTHSPPSDKDPGDGSGLTDTVQGDLPSPGLSHTYSISVAIVGNVVTGSGDQSVDTRGRHRPTTVCVPPKQTLR